MPESEELTVEPRAIEGSPGAACLRLSGNCGPKAVRILQEAVQPLLSQGKKDLLFDCAEVAYFNSTALGFLINLSDTVQSAGGTISFCRMAKKVYATFDLLGLGDVFKFFPDQAAWAREKPAPMETAVLEAAPAPDVEEEQTPAAADFSIALPSWLEEVDPVAAPPLDHLRWSAFLQSAVRRMEVNPLGPIAEEMGIPAATPLVQIVRRVLKRCQSPQELLELFEQSVLARMCRIFSLSAGGSKSDLIRNIIAFVNRSTTESLTSSAALPDEIAPEPASAAPDVSQDRVVKALESCPISKALKSEPAARDHVRKHLASVLGKEEVTRNREVGRQLKSKVEIDVSERYGVLVRTAGGLFGKKADDLKKVLALLGQVVLLAGVYGRGNLLVVLVGEPRQDQAQRLGELRGWLDSAGGRVIHLHP
jgi:anti-anti-sigma factor